MKTLQDKSKQELVELLIIERSQRSRLRRKLISEQGKLKMLYRRLERMKKYIDNMIEYPFSDSLENRKGKPNRR